MLPMGSLIQTIAILWADARVVVGVFVTSILGARLHVSEPLAWRLGVVSQVLGL